MQLIKRSAKGSRLTKAEVDGNFEYLDSTKANKDLSNVSTLPDSVRAQLKGDKGDPGEPGLEGVGIDGTNGATWRSGTTAPSNTLGVDGDHYLNTTSFDVYKKEDGVYSVTCNIKGADGSGGSSGPAFSAVKNSNQSINTLTWTKVYFGQEIFDTNNNYNNSNSVFTPTVRGYYLVTASISADSMTDGSLYINLYKNNINVNSGDVTPPGSGFSKASVSCLVYMNGTTDYLEIFGLHNSTTTKYISGAISSTPYQHTYFQAVLVRTA